MISKYNHHMTPFFSIIIPTLNEEKHLPKLLKDLTKQTFPYELVQIIVVDGHSEDKTQPIVKQHSHIKLINSKKRNVSYQRNLGVTQANGKYIIFFDADTRIPSYFLDGIKYKIARHRPDLFTTWVKPDQKSQTDRFIANFINLSFELGQFTNNPGAMGACLGYKRILTNKPFNENIKFAEDTDFIRRYSKKDKKFCVFQDPKYILSFRRFHKEGTLNLLQKYTKLNIQLLQSGAKSISAEDYPMLGGDYYRKLNKYPKIIDRFDIIFNNIKKIKDINQMEKIKTRIRNII